MCIAVLRIRLALFWETTKSSIRDLIAFGEKATRGILKAAEYVGSTTGYLFKCQQCGLDVVEGDGTHGGYDQISTWGDQVGRYRYRRGRAWMAVLNQSAHEIRRRV